METELIYKYNYGSEDILSGEIIIYKQENSEYILYAKFMLFNKISLPKIKTIYEILTYETNEIKDEHEIFTIKYKIKILGINNPRPEELFIITS